MTRPILLLTLLLNASQLLGQFTDVSFDAGIDFLVDHQSFMGGGVVFFDYDRDEHLDIYITGGEDRDRLYHNLGDGTFEELGIQAGFLGTGDYFSHGAVSGDIDNDGYREIFVTTYDVNTEAAFARNMLFKNNGDGSFTDISATAGILDSAWASSASFGDFNLDGFLDLYVANYVEQPAFVMDSVTGNVTGFAHRCFADNLYMNNGDGTFTDRALEFGITDKGCGLAVAATDYNSDGQIDLMLANDFGEFVVPNRLYQNPGFDDVSTAAGMDADIYGMGIAIGDYDEDGDLDYYITNLGRNILMQNQGDGTFVDVATEAQVENTAVDTLLVTSWGTAFFDYDNDSYLDLFVCNGYIPAAEFIATTVDDPNKFYRNNRDGTFTDISADLGVDDLHLGRGFAVGDYDNDGDQDMMVANLNHFNTPDVKVLLYRNEQTTGNWIALTLEGVKANRDAFGTQVRLHADGRSFMREVDGGSSHASQNSHVLHFGLGEISLIDSLVIYWPGGRQQKVCDIPLNQKSYILEDTSQVTLPTCYMPPNTVQTLAATDLALKNTPNPFSKYTTISYQLPFAADVELIVTNSLGQPIRRLERGPRTAGQYTIDFDATGLASGLYWYTLNVDGAKFTRKMVVF